MADASGDGFADGSRTPSVAVLAHSDPIGWKAGGGRVGEDAGRDPSATPEPVVSPASPSSYIVLSGAHVVDYDTGALSEIARIACEESLDIVVFNLDDASRDGALRVYDPEKPVVPVLSRISHIERYHGVFVGKTLFNKMSSAYDETPDPACMLVSEELFSKVLGERGFAVHDLGDPGTRIVLATLMMLGAARARCLDVRAGVAHVPDRLGRPDDDGLADDDLDSVRRMMALLRAFGRMIPELRAAGVLADPHFRDAVMRCWASILDDAARAMPRKSSIDEAFLDYMERCGRAGCAGSSLAVGDGSSRTPRPASSPSGCVGSDPVVGDGSASESDAIDPEEELGLLGLVDLAAHMVSADRHRRDVEWRDWRAWKAEDELKRILDSSSYRAGMAITAIPRKLKGSGNRQAQTAPEFGTLRGDDGRKVRLIAGLTSFPPRIDAVSAAIGSMMSQTMPFDSIELNLARSQFPRLEDDLPADLLELRDHGLVIGWCDRDTGPYKRYTRTMQENPDAAVVMLDDDICYDPDMLETLYRAHLDHPASVIGMRTHRIVFESDGAPSSYIHWRHEENSYVGVERMDLYATPGAGTLFPPRCLPEEAFDEDLFMELAPNGDDMWLKFMELIADTPVVLARPYGGLRLIDGTQEATSLWGLNRLTSGNDVTMAKLFERFDLYHGPDDTLRSRLRRDIV